MSPYMPHILIDLRALPSTHEVTAYHGGGLFPVLASTPDGAVVAVLRGGAGHFGLAGRLDVICSHDGGQTWTPPSVIADSDHDDRNPAFGTSPQGTLLLAYIRQGNYDEEGTYRHNSDYTDRDVEIVLTRSGDGGLTWESPVPLEDGRLRSGSPYGKIVACSDGTLMMAIYQQVVEELVGAKSSIAHSGKSCSYLIRSRDDGRTWENPSLIGVNMDETALLALPNGDLLAVLRDIEDEEALHSAYSSDGGFTWSEPQQITGARQHPADLLLLTNGDVLLTYGNRNPPYRIEGRLSRDGGRTWLNCLLAFSGHLYGYHVEVPRATDLGYPSSALADGQGLGQVVTMYYYNPSINRSAHWRDTAGSPIYLSDEYRAIAVVWNEKELITAIDRSMT